MLDATLTLHYYTRQHIREAILANAARKEVGVVLGEGFGKRPEVLLHAQDVVEFARQGVTSFHVSEELWSNPLALTSTMSKREQADLREGWDLILDIDCPYWELAKVFTHLFVRALEEHGVKSVGVKFSGNKGFHVGVPFEAFPAQVHKQATRLLFPDGPRKIATYLLDYITMKHIRVEEDLILFGNALSMSLADITALAPDKQLLKKAMVDGKLCVTFDPLSIIALDTMLISARHLYRMPYSLHEKSGLVSIPLDAKDVLAFDKMTAIPDNVLGRPTRLFLDRSEEGSAGTLLMEALDHTTFTTPHGEQNVPFKTHELPEGTFIPEDCFPPCMKLLLGPLDDGKKRAMFILLNFLSSCGWPPEKIEERLIAWNQQHPEPIRENYLVGQLRYFKQHQKGMLPPNCDKYYMDLGVCKPDSLCATIKNPFHYAKKRFLAQQPRKRQRRKAAEDL